MPEQEKPYKLYKGGRAKGKVPLQRPSDGRRKDSGRGSAVDGAPRAARGTLDHALARRRPPARRRLARRELPLGLQRHLGRERRASRQPVLAELKSQSGLLSSTPTTILVLGTDGGTQPGRSDAHRSDSIMLIRTDPSKHRLAFLSIPRDLRVEIPGLRERRRSTPPRSSAARRWR